MPPADLAHAVAALDGWEGDMASIRRTVQAVSFPAAIDLVSQVAQEAERMDHHPDIDIRWRNVTFVLSTHDSGGVTELDLELAAKIDALATPVRRD
ncbi:MAG: 4a-hydroxytetrahydrobiopterin dehydratase [Pseudonocardiaceae bacterium]